MKTFTAWLVASALFATALAQSALPRVDLGYQIQQASSFNQTGQVYNFSNIRYGQAPVGNLRFAAPVAPTGRNTQVNNGSVGSICPQAGPAWEGLGSEFATAYAEGIPFNMTAALAALAAANLSSTPDPRTTEDCLFLDVFTPKHIFDNRNKTGNGTGAAVLVWIYGGGYTGGYKNSGNPSGLIRRSQNNGANGIIFVELNYRLGAFGWLAGPTLQAAGGVSNAGLYDQRLALEWVQKYIHLFGGDPTRVTVIGESAGGGSIMHQITAYGGQKPAPFAQAIPQSPGWLPVPSNYVQENVTQTFLSILGVSSIAEARNMSSEALIAANAKQVGAAPYGQFVYGPVVDGSFVPALPPLLLNQGAFSKNVKIMVGHNADEGPLFTPPYITNDTSLLAYLELAYPTINPSVAEYIVKTLYPAVYDGTYPWTSGLSRTVYLVSESIFTCNTNYLDRAYGNQTYAYEFSVPPAEHGFDIAYTFYNGVAGPEMVVEQVAQAMQQYITDFTQTGAPNGAGVPTFNMYGSNSTEQNLNVTGFMPMRDPTANARCLWWEKALYY